MEENRFFEQDLQELSLDDMEWVNAAGTGTPRPEKKDDPNNAHH